MDFNEKPDQETLDRWHRDPDNWKFGLFYFNPKDKRILPPKRLKAFGWTINFANPLSVLTPDLYPFLLTEIKPTVMQLVKRNLS